MKQVFVIIVCIIYTVSGGVYGQKLNKEKPSLDLDAIKQWHSLDGSAILNNQGTYIAYNIKNMPFGQNTLVVQSTLKSDVNYRYIGANNPFFADSANELIFDRKDSLFQLDLESGTINIVPDIIDYKVPKLTNQRIAIRTKTKELLVKNLLTKKELRYADVDDYFFDNSGESLLIKTSTLQKGKGYAIVKWVDLKFGEKEMFWQSSKEADKSAIGNICFDSRAKQIAFIESDKTGSSITRSIFVIQRDKGLPIKRIADSIIYLATGLSLNNDRVSFSENGKYIFFNGTDPADSADVSIKGNTKVDVWCYRDIKLPTQRKLESGINLYAAVFDIEHESIKRIQYANEEIAKASNAGDYIVLTPKTYVLPSNLDSFLVTPKYYLYSLVSGMRIEFEENKRLGSIVFSPDDKYLVYSYRLEVDKILLVIYNINSSQKLVSFEAKSHKDGPFGQIDRYFGLQAGIAGWMDNSFLFYDNFDILKIDLNGKNKPLNITKGYGLKNNTILRIEKGVQLANNEVLLKGFNIENKQASFLKLNLDSKDSPELLTKGPYDYSISPNQMSLNRKEWLVSRQACNEALNYYLTRDFKAFTRLTDVSPQESYNWISSELINFKQLDGSWTQGILYRPENFDAKKKYPLLFNYYEQRSGQLNDFLQPGLTTNSINIPWFVSRGYLVFIPDIHFSIAAITGKINGDAIYNSVVSAAEYFSKMPWVDSSKMGIQGHSFGGYATNYLITHTQKFAAAAEGAGTSDIVSSYLSLSGALKTPNTDRINIMERAQGRLGVSLWERPDLYLKASPILKLNQVTTPLLITHNMADAAVPWGQALELFLGLRRLGKSVWMLQYDNGNHSVSADGAEDHTIRLTQFFNHYLKSAPAPIWMSRGIRAFMKGIITGYEFDPSGNCGKDCKVCKMWNNKMSKDSVATLKEIQEKTKTEHWMCGE